MPFAKLDRRTRALLARAASRAMPFSIESFCFPEQVRFIRDPAQFKTGLCSRRAGKTIACAADLIDTALRHARTVCLYLTLSRLNAKRIIWGEILEINRQYNLGGKANETELCLTLPNGSKVYCSGAKDRQEVEKFRGFPLKKVYIDEAQAFRSYIKILVDDVLSKSLYDYNGSLCLIGTPGAVPTGYFYDCTVSKEWSHHSWTMLQNPWIEKKSGHTPMALILADCKRMGVDVSHAAIQRECFGRWSVDNSALVFKYDAARNHFAALPAARQWEYVIGIDIGFDDADAISVIGWNEKSPTAYLVYETTKRKQGVTELADQVAKLIKIYDPSAIVMDTGGLGKKIAEELCKRFELPIKPAEKVRKFEYIELLNDAMRTGRFMARSTGLFAQDCNLVEWDRDKSTGDKLVVSARYHSDIADSTLYAFREAMHWLHVPEVVPPKPGTAEWQAAMEAAMIEDMEAEVMRQKDDPVTWGVGDDYAA